MSKAGFRGVQVYRVQAGDRGHSLTRQRERESFGPTSAHRLYSRSGYACLRSRLGSDELRSDSAAHALHVT